MKKINCYIRNLEPYGAFVACFLHERCPGKSAKFMRAFKSSTDFYNKCVSELERFLEHDELSHANLEKWFARFVRYMLNFTPLYDVLKARRTYRECLQKMSIYLVGTNQNAGGGLACRIALATVDSLRKMSVSEYALHKMSEHL